MTDSSYDSTGISLIRYTDILANMIADAESSWDESVDTTINDAQDAFLGHLFRNMSLVVSDINELLQEIYDTASVANATGTRLDHLLSLIGLERPGDVASTVTLTLSSDRATTVSAGSQYKTATGIIFETDSSSVFSTGLGAAKTVTGATQADPVVITSTAHGLSNGNTVILKNVGGMTELNNNLYKVANVATNTFELNTYADADIDGTGFTAYTSGGTAQTVEENSVAATCTIFGANNAAIGDLDTQDGTGSIVTSVSGIIRANNLVAAVPGRLQATDAEQKASHTLAVSTSGLGDDASIYEALIGVTGVSAASVVANDTDATADGVPARTLHCVTIGGASADVAAAIHDNKVSSVPTYGSTTVAHYDTTTKQSKDINFDTGTNRPVYIDIDVTLINGEYDDDYAAQLRANLVTHFSDFRIGDDVLYTALYQPIYSVDGIIVNTLETGLTASPSGTVDITIDSDELAQMTTAQAATNVVITTS